MLQQSESSDTTYVEVVQEDACTQSDADSEKMVKIPISPDIEAFNAIVPDEWKLTTEKIQEVQARLEAHWKKSREDD